MPAAYLGGHGEHQGEADILGVLVLGRGGMQGDADLPGLPPAGQTEVRGDGAGPGPGPAWVGDAGRRTYLPRPRSTRSSSR